MASNFHHTKKVIAQIITLLFGCDVSIARSCRPPRWHWLDQVDLLCSHWFVETDWVRLLFREKWETPATAEVGPVAPETLVADLFRFRRKEVDGESVRYYSPGEYYTVLCVVERVSGTWLPRSERAGCRTAVSLAAERRAGHNHRLRQSFGACRSNTSWIFFFEMSRLGARMQVPRSLPRSLKNSSML